MNRYKLGDLTIKSFNGWDNVPRMPQAVAAAVASSFAGAAVGTLGAAIAISAGTAAIYAGAYIATTLAATAVTSYAINALAGKPSFSAGDLGLQSSRAIQNNDINPLAPQRIIYGRARVGGTIVFRGVSGKNNKFLNVVYAIAGHEIDEIEKIYFNDKEVTVNASGQVTTSRWKADDGSIRINIEERLGTASQEAPTLLKVSQELSDNFKGSGIAYVYIGYTYDENIYRDGLPLVTFQVKGKKVYDPRTGTTAWSQNAALCIRDFIVDERGLDDLDVNDTSFSAAANICDENVTKKGGGTQDRYTIDGTIQMDQAIGDVLTKMTSACAGTLYWSTGKWNLNVGAFSSSVKTLTFDDLRGPIQTLTSTSLADKFNAVKGTFNNENRRYISQDYPQYSPSTYLEADNNIEAVLDLPLPYTTNYRRAQRLSRLTLNRLREDMTVQADFSLAALDLEIGDTVSLTHDRYGWSAKTFEVLGWKLITNEGPIKINLTLREISSTVFDWNADEVEIETNDTTLPDITTVPEAGFTLSSELVIANEQVRAAINVEITTTDPYADIFEVQYKKSTETKYKFLGRGKSTKYDILAAEDGDYNIRVRAINPHGYIGSYTTKTFELAAFAPVPADVTNFAGNVIGDNIHLTWTPTPDLDLSHYKIRYSNRTSGATYSNSIDLVKKIARPANSVVVPAQTGTYFIKAVDKVGGLSENATSFVVFHDPLNISAFNVVQTITEHPNFTGVKDDVVLTDDGSQNYLVLRTETLFDDGAGDFDDAEGLFDSGFGTVDGAGVYYFAGSTDLGQKYTSRLYPTFSVDHLDYVNSFDSATGLFDDREGLFDGDADEFDVTSMTFQCRFTDDDPSGSPIWSAWQDLFVSDISARAFEYRALLNSSDGNSSPAVKELGVIVDMPDRVESQSDITFTGSQAITFPAAFKETPAIGISLSNLADGDRYAITSKSRTGFTVTIYTGGSTSTNSVTLDYVAKGYGKELT